MNIYLYRATVKSPSRIYISPRCANNCPSTTRTVNHCCCYSRQRRKIKKMKKIVYGWNDKLYRESKPFLSIKWDRAEKRRFYPHIFITWMTFDGAMDGRPTKGPYMLFFGGKRDHLCNFKVWETVGEIFDKPQGPFM